MQSFHVYPAVAALARLAHDFQGKFKHASLCRREGAGGAIKSICTPVAVVSNW